MSEPASETILQRYAAIGISPRLVRLFAAITAVSSVTILLGMPGLTGPVIVVFIPTVTAVILIRVSAGLGLMLRSGVSGLRQ